MLDTQAFLLNADREAPQEMVDKLIGEVEAGDDAFQARRAKFRKEWELEYVAQRVAEGAEEVQARAEITALDHQVLLGGNFVTRSGVKITIGEILFDPGKYEGEIGPDPIEAKLRAHNSGVQWKDAPAALGHNPCSPMAT